MFITNSAYLRSTFRLLETEGRWCFYTYRELADILVDYAVEMGL